MLLESAEGRGVADGREDDGWRPWLLQTELGDERWGGGRRGPGKGKSERGGQRDRDDTGKSSTRPGDRRQAGGGRERTRARHASPLPTGRRKKTALPSVGWAATVPEQVGRPR